MTHRKKLNETKTNGKGGEGAEVAGEKSVEPLLIRRTTFAAVDQILATELNLLQLGRRRSKGVKGGGVGVYICECGWVRRVCVCVCV